MRLVIRDWKVTFRSIDQQTTVRVPFFLPAFCATIELPLCAPVSFSLYVQGFSPQGPLDTCDDTLSLPYRREDIEQDHHQADTV